MSLRSVPGCGRRSGPWTCRGKDDRHVRTLALRPGLGAQAQPLVDGQRLAWPLTLSFFLTTIFFLFWLQEVQSGHNNKTVLGWKVSPVVTRSGACFSLSQLYNRVEMKCPLEGWFVAIVVFLLVLPSLLESGSLAGLREGGPACACAQLAPTVGWVSAPEQNIHVDFPKSAGTSEEKPNQPTNVAANQSLGDSPEMLCRCL